MKKIRNIPPLLFLFPVVVFGQSFNRASFLEAFKDRIWNNAALVGGSRIACQNLRLGVNGATWTREFADVPQLAAVLHAQKADLVLSLAAIAAEETGVPLLPPRVGSPQFRQAGGPPVRPLVDMVGSNPASARPLPDFFFSAFAVELLGDAFDSNTTCKMSQTSWTPEPSTAAEWGKSLCLQMNQIVAGGRSDFARRGAAQSAGSGAVTASLPKGSSGCSYDEVLKPLSSNPQMAELAERNREKLEARKQANEEQLREQQHERDLQREAQQKRAAEAQKARDAVETKFMATDYGKRLTSTCIAGLDSDSHSTETLLPSEKIKAHDTTIKFCGCISRRLAVDPDKIDADQRATFEMIISAQRTHSKIPNLGVRDRFAQEFIACVTPDMVFSGAVSVAH